MSLVSTTNALELFFDCQSNLYNFANLLLTPANFYKFVETPVSSRKVASELLVALLLQQARQGNSPVNGVYIVNWRTDKVGVNSFANPTVHKTEEAAIRKATEFLEKPHAAAISLIFKLVAEVTREKPPVKITRFT